MTARCTSCHITTELITNKTICCKCSINRSKQSINKLKGFLKRLVSNAKTNSKNRKNDCSFSITYNDILQIYDKQNGLCYYSKIPMKTQQNCDWQCSIERKNPSTGYDIDNIVLCCAEFNGRIQWSKEKFSNLLSLYYMPIKEYVHYKFELEVKSPQKRLKIDKKIIDGNEHFSCNICGLYKERNNYFKEFKYGCNTCHSVLERKRLSTPRGHMQSLLSRSRNHVCRMNKNKKRGIKFEHDLNFDFLIELWNNQEGRCAYSNISMYFGSCLENDWICSLERINSNKGYVKENVCFICAEFNTSIRLSQDIEVFGDSGWNIKKFNKIIENNSTK